MVHFSPAAPPNDPRMIGSLFDTSGFNKTAA
jgi:hypothetical protein